MSVESDALLETINIVASQPSYVQGDAGAVTMRPISELIAAHKYVTSTTPVAGNSARRGLRFSKINPPGAV